MGNDKFEKLCKVLVATYYNQSTGMSEGKTITEDDVYIVWLCKILGNNKALVSTTVADGMYYEVTHNGDKGEIYIDAYKKWENIAVAAEDAINSLLNEDEGKHKEIVMREKED